MYSIVLDYVSSSKTYINWEIKVKRKNVFSAEKQPPAVGYK